jgi:MarR family transcriptional regulator, negative regulator of the multidrug operon emrRAB
MDPRLPNLLAAVALLVQDALDECEVSDTAVGSSAAAALVSVGHRQGLSIEALSASLGLTHSGTVRLVDRLEAAGTVQRRKADGRSVGLWLTSQGRRRVRSINSARLSAVARLIPALSTDEARSVDAFLCRILAAHANDDDDLYRICRICSFDACQANEPCPVDLAVSA